MGPGYTDGLSNDGADVFQLYWEKENPKLPHPSSLTSATGGTCAATGGTCAASTCA